MSRQDFFFFLMNPKAERQSRAVVVTRARSFEEAERSLKEKYAWVFQLAEREVADLLGPRELDPVNCASALRYTAEEYRGILSEEERSKLHEVAGKVIATLWS